MSYRTCLGRCRWISPTPEFIGPGIPANYTYRCELGSNLVDSLAAWCLNYASPLGHILALVRGERLTEANEPVKRSQTPLAWYSRAQNDVFVLIHIVEKAPNLHAGVREIPVFGQRDLRFFDGARWRASDVRHSRSDVARLARPADLRAQLPQAGHIRRFAVTAHCTP